MLNDQQKAAITCYVRTFMARYLREERAAFRRGAEAVEELDHRYFTSVKTEAAWSATGALDLSEINKQLELVRERVALNPRSSTPVATFGSEQTADSCPCSGCYCSCCGSYEPNVVITFKTPYIPRLEGVRKVVAMRIKSVTGEFEWKIERQPGGRDARRYLEIIAKYSGNKNAHN